MAGRSRSPARRATPRKSTTESKGGRSKVSPTTKHVSETLALHTILALGVVAVFLATLRFGLITKFVCPMATKLYLTPLGLGALKARALTYLAIAWYALVTFLLMTVIMPFMAILAAGRCMELSRPREQRSALGGVSTRLYHSQSNNIEAFILLLASVMVSWNAGIADDKVLEMVTYFLTARKMYVISYALDMHRGRVFCFLSALMPCFYLFYLSIVKFL
ncbi:hypothetical protein PSACC_01615 [Paramicrosporidium saccamoebae]|uniref:MAPEG family protein n=1 Tax=Paramicrosporidium saccamoebae TaxID=1246581 RepID=A0A2H9TLF3_9FUNG|nr:hypothetical protein PSACC_01615 [Paramicrosporidium saccamoebae]